MKNISELGSLIEEVRLLLGWPTNRKLVRLVDKYPSEQVWEYALARLKKADHPNEKYLVACLETALTQETPRHGRQRLITMTSPIWFCYTCGYAIEYCRLTANWELCPLCLRRGKESKLIYIDRSVPDWGRG